MEDFKKYYGKETPVFTKANPDYLTLRRASNGGWLVVGNDLESGRIVVFNVVYSNMEEMIAGLIRMLKD